MTGDRCLLDPGIFRNLKAGTRSRFDSSSIHQEGDPTMQDMDVIMIDTGKYYHLLIHKRSWGIGSHNCTPQTFSGTSGKSFLPQSVQSIPRFSFADRNFFVSIPFQLYSGLLPNRNRKLHSTKRYRERNAIDGGINARQ
jgi:hypothetical protein